jgi:5-methylcytosine-specific restriction endonuclease McrA
MCSQWAGVWSGSSINSIEAFSKTLSDAHKSIKAINDADSAHQAWEDCFAKFVDGLSAGAINYINTLAAPTRDRVAIYRSVLWVWHRLDQDRWGTSQVQLRVGKSKPNIEVDHIVSYALWKQKVAATENQSDEDATALVNRLGNCALLEKNFNISKSDKGLKSFLAQIHEVIQKKIRIDAWCAALEISQPMLDPSPAAIIDVMDAIENRDKEIRSDLIEFVRGTRVRVDVPTPVHAKQSGPGTTPQESPAAPTTQPSPDPVEHITTTPTRSGTDIVGLRAAYAEDTAVRVIIDHFASRQYSQNVTELDALRDKLERNGMPFEKPHLIRALRRLDALGVGRFLVGRRGQATRFEWHEKSLTVRKLATDQASVQPA